MVEITNPFVRDPSSAAEWIYPDMCIPPHKVTHPDKVDSLAKDFEDYGWWGPALIGYFTYDKPSEGYALQLLSGSHRWAAALLVGVKIPVIIKSEGEVEAAWGHLDKWKALMATGKNTEYWCSYGG